MRIIVVGAGIIGLSCSWKLARRGAHVTLFDARQAGQGASAASLGALWPPSALLENPVQQLHRQSLWTFDAFITDLSHAAKLPIPFDRRGRLELLLSQPAAADARAQIAAASTLWPALKKEHPPQEFLTPAELHNLLPTFSLPNHGALLCHNTAQVHMPSLLAALQRACLRAGVTLHENTPITELLPSGVRTTTTTHTADAILLTAGVGSSTLLPSAKISPVKGQALAIERPPNLRLPHLLKSGSTYLVPWQSEILIGATTEPHALFDETLTAPAREKLLAAAIALLPELAAAKLLRQWAGLRPHSPTHQPLMGRVPHSPNLFLCTGHYKIGVALAPLASDLMTAHILDATTPSDLLPFIPPSP